MPYYDESNIPVSVRVVEDAFIPRYILGYDTGAYISACYIEEAYAGTIANDNNDGNPDLLLKDKNFIKDDDSFSKDGYILKPGCAVLIDCGVECKLPPSYSFMICSRSKLQIRNHVRLLNGFSNTVSADGYVAYKVLLYNEGKYNFKIKKYDKIGKLRLIKNPRACFIKDEVISKNIFNKLKNIYYKLINIIRIK